MQPAASRDQEGNQQEVTALPQPCEDVVVKRVGEDVLLVQLRTNRIFALNETGRRGSARAVPTRASDERYGTAMIEAARIANRAESTLGENSAPHASRATH